MSREPPARSLLLSLALGVAAQWPSPALSQSVTLDQFRPAETAEDGFATSQPDDRGHLRAGAVLGLDYALNPLVYERVRGDGGTELLSVVEHQLAAHVGLSFALWDRLVLYTGLPVNLAMSGASTVPAPFDSADGTGLGDLWVGARGRLFGERDEDECVSCATAPACDDGNPCTTDTCSGAGLCSATPVAAGTTCEGGVCNGAPAECVVCFDSAATGTDLGCTGSAPNCDGSGTAGAICQPCIDTTGGGPDLGCSGALGFCLPYEETAGINTCQQCEDALDCDDGDDCTIDSCPRILFSPTVGIRQCRHTASPVGASCTGGVCNGEAGGCVPCLDDSLTGVDSGCNRVDQHCLGTGESASCELCIDTVESGADLGCSDTQPFCVPVPPGCELCEDSVEAGTDRGCTNAEPSCEERDGARVCVPVPGGDDGGPPQLDGGVTEQPGLAGGALCSVRRGLGAGGGGGSGAGGSLAVLLAALGWAVARRRRR
jgi:hypothetical protein